jgi:hypothetical protein
VESGIGHTKRTPLKGQRFESLEEAQAYLDRWEQRWADTRIHGTTKRQVAAMFAEEKPLLLPLPLEPFRYYQYGERVVHLDGCVEVEAAYYSLPPGWIGRPVKVQWDMLHVRILHPKNRALRQLPLGGIAAVLETRLQQAQAEPMAPIDFLSCLVSDELTRRGDRLLERRRKQAQFRDPQRTLDNFDFNFNKKMNRSLVFDLATAAFVARREDALFLGPPGTGKSHLAQAIGQAVIGQGYRVIYREAELLEIVNAPLRTSLHAPNF